MFMIFRFIRSILNIQILKIVSSEPQERTIHFNKTILEKANDPIFPLKKLFQKGSRVPGLLQKQIKRTFKISVSNHMIS